MKKGTKILSLAAALMLVGSTVALTGCGEDKSYKGEETLAQYQAAMANGGEVKSNGGFAVEKGGFVYFINGIEETTAKNAYGTPEKGSLMRIAKSDLAAGKYDQAKVVVPSIFSSQGNSSGVYIYGDYVYYATPTTDKNLSGQTGNAFIDVKRAKLDGTQAPMSGYYLRLPSSAMYRFVQVDGVDRNKDGKDDVFCLYQESESATMLSSYNTATGDDVVLVKNATKFFYDTSDLDNPNVYYTMPVKLEIEQDNSVDVKYNQIYCVNAAAQVTAVDANKASYTVTYSDGGTKTYDFDEKAMKKNADAKGYKLGEYATYPYVNLGQLVLDGVGFASTYSSLYNEEKAANITTATAKEAQGYTYEIKRYETSGANAGLFFTRKAVMGSESTKLCYVADSEALASGWNTVDKNNSLDIVANDAAEVKNDALIQVGVQDGKRVFTCLYTEAENNKMTIKRAVLPQAANDEGNKLTDKPLGEDQDTTSSTKLTLRTTNGNYLYYSMTGTKGENLYRINYTGAEDDYNSLVSDEEHKAVQIPFVEYNSAWAPEFVGDMVMFANAQNYGDSTASYDYVYVAKVGATEDLVQANKDYKAYVEYRAEYEGDSETADTDVASLIGYLFGCDLDVTAEAKAEYIKKFNKSNNDEDDTEAETFYQAILDKFDATKPDYIKDVKNYVNAIGRMTESDVEDMNEAWDNLLLYPEEEEEVAKEGMPAWAIWLIVLGSVIVVAAAVSVPVVLYLQKKKAAKREADAIVNSYKRQRIDTTDDKTIDVYADDSAEEPTEEVVEEPVEEPAVETVEEPAVETAEEVVEEPVAEVAEEPTEETAADADGEEKTE